MQPPARGAQYDTSNLMSTAVSERLGTILELTQSFVFIAELRSDRTARMLWASDEFTTLFGYTVEDVAAMGGPLTMLQNDDVDLALKMMDEVAPGKHANDEVRMVTASGDPRWLRFHYRVEDGPSDDGTVRIFGVAQDVTPHVEARQQLRATAARFGAVFVHSPVGHAVIATDGTFLAANPAYCEMTGYREDELVGHHFSIVVEERYLERAHARFREVIETGSFQSEATLMTKDGRQIEVAMTAIGLTEMQQVVYSVQDLTEIRRAAAERELVLQKAVEMQTHERMQLARRLHDGLGQLLTAASLSVDALEERDLEPDAAAHVADIRRELEEALVTTRRLAWRMDSSGEH